MIRLRHQQPSLWETFFAEEVAELWEPWMQVVDELLQDDESLDIVYEAQGKRHLQSRTHGRPQTPAEVVLRMLILKHVRNWSYEVLEREVRANLVYRSFCRIGLEKVPDAKTLVRLGQAVGPEWSLRYMRESLLWRRPNVSCRGARCAWTPRSWKPTFTTRPTAACSVTARAF